MVTKSKRPARGFRRLLAPVDFSSSSRDTFSFAVGLAEELEARLTVLHVCPPLALAVAQPDELEKFADNSLGELRRSAGAGFRKIRPAVAFGVPHFQVVEYAKRVKADLIVVSTHGHTGLKHILLGSTAERIVRHASCSVLVYRKPGSVLARPVKRRGRFRRILCPVDFSSLSGVALKKAAWVARDFGGALQIVHVVEPPVYPQYALSNLPIQERKLRQSAGVQLERFLSETSIDPDLISTRKVRYGTPFREILEEARKRKSDLIVLATHGYSGLSHVVLGSTSERVVQHGPCSVMVLR